METFQTFFKDKHFFIHPVSNFVVHFGYNNFTSAMGGVFKDTNV